jgi:hypothetical protein
MTLQMYLRQKLHTYIRPLYIKDKCEICESTTNIELHHDYPFSMMLTDILEDLGLELKENARDYTVKELRMIKTMIYGMHIENKMTNVCEDCHKNMHDMGSILKYSGNFENYYNKLRLQKEAKEREDNIKLEKYLSENVGMIMLERKDREELIKMINARDINNNRLLKNIETLNAKLVDINSPYIIKKFETSRMIDGEKKKYKNVWKLIHKINN